MKSVSKKILIINGSLGGAEGNCHQLIKIAKQNIEKQNLICEIIHLVNNKSDLVEIIHRAAGFVFVSGTYWDSWGSPMQEFLEQTTQYEASDLFLFKPASVIITMHSVGGKGVLSRLQGVLNTIGLLIPPMSGLVYSLATQLSTQIGTNEFSDDFWNIEDIEIVIHNLITAVNQQHSFKSWPVDRKDPKRRWISS